MSGLAALTLGTLAWGLALHAQDAEEGSGTPQRAVRLSYVDGQVRLAQGNQVLADQAVANTPLFEGSQLTTNDSGKAEIQFEDGSVARLSPDSAMTLTELRGAGASAEAQLAVTSGLAYFEFQGGGQGGQMSVLFGDCLVTTSGFTVLRVDMDSPPGQLAVFSGNAHVQSANGAVSVDLHGGESIALNGNDPSQYNLAESIEPDSWDAWNSDRDEALTAEEANQTEAPADMGQSQNPAWSDLDANGNWYDVPGQGYVWSPYDAGNADFDPYSNGSWMWYPGYGYIWASAYPWGYLPYQCGAWNFYNGFGWGWAPGMGGCMPWWGVGFYGGPNIGYAPPGYRTVVRPLTPRRPLNGRPVAIIPVHRGPGILNPGLPPRDRTRVVTIAGKPVIPLSAQPNRPVFDRGPSTFGGNGMRNANSGARTTVGQPYSPRPGYSSNRPVGANPAPGSGGDRSSRGNQGGEPARPIFTGGSPGNRPSGGGNPSAGGPPSRTGGGGYSGGGAPRPSPAPSGGGGGNPHPSGGGFSGGGGGGGSHPSGGGSPSGGGGGGFHGGGGSPAPSGGGGGGFHGGGGGGNSGGGGGGGSHGGGGSSGGGGGHH